MCFVIVILYIIQLKLLVLLKCPPSLIFAPVLTKKVSREATWVLTSQQARQGVDGSHR